MNKVDDDFKGVASGEGLMQTPIPYADDELQQTVLPNVTNDEETQSIFNPEVPQTLLKLPDDGADDVSEAFNTQTSDDSAFQNSGVSLRASTATAPRAQDLQLDFGEKSTDLPFTYVEEEHNLQFPVISADSVNADKPHTSFQVIGDWLKQATDVQTYWNALESLGEDVADYTWAYNEGNMGEFDAGAFGKEALKAGARGFTSDNLRMVGNVLSYFGTNIENKNLTIGMMTSGAALFAPKAGSILKNIGHKFQNYADKIDTSSVLAPSVEAYNTDPSWAKLANVLGQGSAQVLTMGALSKYIGAGPTYLLFAGGGAAQVFNESYQKDENVDVANTAALLSGGTTFVIDKLFNPLPKQISESAKMTSQMIAKEVVGAPLREAGSEVLQQLLAENLVRKVGIDDTQELFEGLIESALGAIAGTSALMGADGSIYYARKTYDDVRQRMLLKGVSDEEIELFKKSTLEFLQQKPEAFGKVLSYSLEQNLKAMEKAATEAEPQDRSLRKADIKAFRKIYDTMYKRTLKATNDKSKAQITAGMMQATAMALYDVDKTFSPQKILMENVPEVKQTTYENFKKNLAPNTSVLFQFGGINAKYADFKRLGEAYRLEAEDYMPRFIWNKTGWYRGTDGKWRFEISDAKAKLKLDFNVKEDELPKQYWKSYVRKLEEIEAQDIIQLRSLEDSLISGGSLAQELYNYMYDDFIEFLDKNYNGHFSFKQGRTGDVSILDPEHNYEKRIEDEKGQVATRVQGLLDGYMYLSERNKQHATSEMPLLRDMTLKQVLMDREKFDVLDENDTRHLVSANENAEVPNAQEQLSGQQSGTAQDVLAVVRSSDYKKGADEDFNQAMNDLLSTYQNMKVYNPSLQREIEISTPSLMLEGNLDDTHKMLIPYLPMLLEKGVFYPKNLGRQKEPDAKAYYQAVLPIEIDGQKKHIALLLKEDTDGRLVWNAELRNISAKEAEHTTRAPLKSRQSANTNVPPLGNIYTSEQMKIIRSAMEEYSYLNFIGDIWRSAVDVDKNIERLDKFLNKAGVKTSAFENYVQSLDEDLQRQAGKREAAIKRLGLPDVEDFYEDVDREKFYRMYLAGQGDFHKPYFNMNYMQKLYRDAHIPLSMVDRFFAQPQYRYMTYMEKTAMADLLDQVYRIYRFHKELDFARLAEKRDIQAANAFVQEHLEDGDESLRRYWAERQLLLDKKEMKLGDLLDHEELYKNYPELKDVTVRFDELNNDDGYHFYHDRNLESDVLEIDPRMFDYANLKDLLMKGAAFAIQMKEHFDLSLSETQMKNFMDRHIYLAKAEVMPKIINGLDLFFARYMPEERAKNYVVEKDMPISLLDIYKSQSKNAPSNTAKSSQSVQHVKYSDIDFDAVFKKMDEKYGQYLLDPDERKLADFAYSELMDLRHKMNMEMIIRARISSGYYITAPFPWMGEASQGNIDMRAMLRRQNYSDWQRSFAYWDDAKKEPMVDKSKLNYASLQRYADYADSEDTQYPFLPESKRILPDDDETVPSVPDAISSTNMAMARGAYDMADKTIYLFEKANAETIVHETFHYLSQLFQTSQFNRNSYLTAVYNREMERFRKVILENYEVVKADDGYRLFYRKGEKYLPDIPRRFFTAEEAVTDGAEEIFVDRLLYALDHKLYPENEDEDLLFYFYTIWLDHLTNTVLVHRDKYNDDAKNLLSNANRYHSKARSRFMKKLDMW